MLSIALGVALLVATFVLLGLFERLFRQTGSGYDLIAGPRGSEVQLVTSIVYRIEKPIDAIPYRFYTQVRDDPRVEHAIPLAVGDNTNVGNFPIVGTTARYFVVPATRRGGEAVPFQLRGEVLSGPWDAVIGAEVARTNGWTIGSQFQLLHSGADAHVHDEKFTVVGVLEPTGTPNDRTAFISLAGFLALDEHGLSIEEAIEKEARFFGETNEAVQQRYAGQLEGLEKHGNHYHGDVPDLLYQVSAALLTTKSKGADDLSGQMRSFDLRNNLNQMPTAMAVNPVSIMTKFTDRVIGPLEQGLSLIAAIVIVVTAIGVFVSIYNSMADRRREIGIMRALGARRGTVLGIILAEAALLCVLGGVLGLVLGHLGVFALSPLVSRETGITINPLAFETAELYVFPVLLVLGLIAGVLPGLTAYRTDVASALDQ